MAQFLSTSELDFEGLKENLKTFMQSQPQFQDYDFEGSNLSALLDVLVYNTYLNGFYLNQIGTEMFLDTALLKESVSSHAKELNYIPRSRGSSSAVVNLSVTGDATQGSKTIPQFTTFTATIGSNSAVFSTDAEIVAINDGTGRFIANNVSIYEGTLVTEFFEADADMNKVVISSANVDISSIDVTIQNSSTDLANTTYTQVDELFNLTPTSKVFFVQPYGTNKYEIEFGNDVTGKSLDVGNIVRVRYRDCSGSSGDGATSFTANDGTITPTTVSKSTGGSERETIASIKFNAPRVFSTQDRAITVEDYKSLVKAKFPYVQSLNVIGGENLDPPRFGKVKLVAKPYGGTYLSQSQKSAIVNYLKGKTSETTEVITGDAEFINIHITSAVQYNSSQTTYNNEQIRDLVITAINNYNTLQLSEFDKDFRLSKLVADIDDVDDSIISNNTKVSIVKRINPSTLIPSTVSISFDQRIRDEIDYGVSAITSSKFIREINGSRYEVSLKSRDVAAGSSAAIIDLISTQSGSAEVVAYNIGVVDFVSGEITLNDFVVTEYFARSNEAYGSHINVIARPYDSDILAEKDQILDIDSSDIAVTVTAKLTDD